MPSPDLFVETNYSPRSQQSAVCNDFSEALVVQLVSRIEQTLGSRFDALESLLMAVSVDTKQLTTELFHVQNHTGLHRRLTRRSRSALSVRTYEGPVDKSPHREVRTSPSVASSQPSFLWPIALSSRSGVEFEYGEDPNEPVPCERDENIPPACTEDCNASVTASQATTGYFDDMVEEVSEERDHDERLTSTVASNYGASIRRGGSMKVLFRGAPSVSSMDLIDYYSFFGLLVPRKCAPNAMTPNGSIRVVVDMLSLLLLLYDAVTIPFIVAWNPNLHTPFFFLFFLSPGFWTADMCLSFFTGFYHNDSGELELRLSRTARHYARTRFPIDLVVNAIDWLFIIVEWDNNLAPMRILKGNRFFRVFSMFRMARLWMGTTRFREWLVSDTWHMMMQIVKLFFIILYLNHLVSCVWYGIGVWRSGSDTGATWLDSLDDVRNKDFWQASVMYQYTTALHWAMTQMTPGSMEITPMNSNERICNILCLLNGLLFGTSLISQLSAKMIQLQLAKREQLTNVLLLRRYINQERLSPSLCGRVVKDVNKTIAIPKRLKHDEVPYLAILSTTLRAELQFEMLSPHLLKDPVFLTFNIIDKNVVRDICLFMNIMYFKPAEELFDAGTPMKDPFIVSRGNLVYTRIEKSDITSRHDDTSSAVPNQTSTPKRSRLEAHRSDGTTLSLQVAEGAWIAKMSLWTKWLTRGTMIATSNCDIFRLNVDKLVKALAHHIKIERVWEGYTNAFSEYIVDLPGVMINDLTTNVDLGEVVQQMVVDIRMMIAHAVLKYVKNHERMRWIVLASRKDILQELEFEVRNGKCVMLLNNERVPERITFVTALRITRPDGRILAQIAKKKNKTDGHFEAACQLPGVKPEQFEPPQDTILRVMTKRLAGMEVFSTYEAMLLWSAFASRNCEKTWSYAMSRAFAINTKYVRSIYQMSITEEEVGWNSTVDVLDINGSKWTRNRKSVDSASSNAKDWSNGTLQWVYPIGSQGIGTVFAWLTQEDFEHLTSPSHADDLEKWVATIALDVERKSGSKLSLGR